MPDVKEVIRSLETSVKNFERYSGDEYGREYDYARVEVETLEDAIALLKAQEPEAMDAPKPDSDIGCWYDITHNYTLEQVISALKAQEPRVMTESELEGYISSLDGEARVWIEHKKLGLYCASLWSRNPSRGDQNFYDVMHECYFDRSEIGKWWRPWTSRPTDEQREAVKWE